MITISLRSYSSHILSLLHFDYPYYAEPGDGLTDEIGGFTWTRSGSAKLAGSQAPADLILSGTPKFGYRCLHTDAATDFITGVRALSLTLPQLECSMWMRVTASGSGSVLHLKNSSSAIASLSLNAENRLVLSSSNLGLNLTTTDSLTLNSWAYVRVQISVSGASVSINNNAATSASVSETLSALPEFNTITLGGFKGQIDEFTLRDSFTSSLPSAPTQATCNVQSLGGFGSGKLGNVTITSNCIMNTCAGFRYKSQAETLGIISNIRTGKFGAFAEGDEVMLLNMRTGVYVFKTISRLSGSDITLNTYSSAEARNFMSSTQIIKIPNFNALTVNSGITISPHDWDGSSGGVIAFRCKGNCTINGQLITSGKGRKRTDTQQLTHSKLLDNFITNTGGGIFITCGGVFTAGSSARLGATWSGEGEGGSPVARAKGNPGGAGYGGAGGSDVDDVSIGGKGGVGGGGGGSNSGTGLDAGGGNTTGGHGAVVYGVSDAIGGTQGVTTGGNSPDWQRVTGGGGAGGCSGGSLYDGRNTPEDPYCKGASSGANIILITKTLKVDSAAISTGGEGGNANNEGTGGGGTGFCYIACESMTAN